MSMNKQISMKDFTDEQMVALCRFITEQCYVEGDQLYYNDNEPITNDEALFIFQDSDYFPR